MAALLLSAVCLFLSPVSVYAAQVDTWDGTADTRWYDAENPQKEYVISTAEELAGLAKLVDENLIYFTGCTITLANDLDLSGYEWSSIGQGANVYGFAGTFDGAGHTISHLYSHTAQNYFSLFGTIYGATIKDLRVTDADIDIPSDNSAISSVGVIASSLIDSKIIGCYASGTISNSSTVPLAEKYIGGIAGDFWVSSLIQGCGSSVNIRSTSPGGPDGYDVLGGIVGADNFGSSKIIGCWFDGSITSTSDFASIGGIAGAMESSSLISNSIVASNDIDGGELDTVYWIAPTAGNIDSLYCVYPSDPKYPAVASGSTLATLPSDNFLSQEVLSFLQQNAPEGTKWVAGINHPVLEDDVYHMSANYSAFDEVKHTIPSDLTLYTDDSVANLNAALAAVPERVPATQQSAVDKAVKAVEDAIAALVYKPADYTAVDAALSKVESLKKDEYIDFAKVDAAVKVVVRGYNITQQTQVDAMANSIEEAIASLEYKPADYAAVDAAIQKVEALDKDAYKDFSKVDAAVTAVVRGKNITQQAEVDAMAATIEDAIAALEQKPTEQPEPEPDQEETTHTVTLVWGGDLADETVKVKDGEALPEPNDRPELKGYTFTGSWYLTKAQNGDLSDPYDFSKPVTEDLTLYAGWTKDTLPAEEEKTPQGSQEQPEDAQKKDSGANVDAVENPASKKDVQKKGSQSVIPQTGDAAFGVIAPILAVGAAILTLGLKLRRN